MCDMTHSYVRRDSFRSATCLMGMRGIRHGRSMRGRRHARSMRALRHGTVTDYLHLTPCVIARYSMCDMTHSCVGFD